jgi:hypothetical protein
MMNASHALHEMCQEFPTQIPGKSSGYAWPVPHGRIKGKKADGLTNESL